MKKFVSLSLLVLLSVITPISSFADTILVFGQSTGLNLFTGDETAGTTVLNADSIPVIITTLDEAASNINAFFSLDATSTASAINVFGDAWTQAYTGDFQITSGAGGTGFNYLSGDFDGVQLGLDGGGTIVFGSAEPPLSLTFTSDVVGMPLDIPRGMALSLTNVLPEVTIVNNSFGDFTANVSGTFSASETAVPEPLSLSMLGIGLTGFAVRFRRTRKRV